jgi:hypothetical protein
VGRPASGRTGAVTTRECPPGAGGRAGIAWYGS